MQLREFQINFKNFICDLAAITFTAEPVAGLDIYKANYFCALTAALKNKFPNSSKFLQDKFIKLATKYIILHSSSNSNLDEFGNLFPTFLKETDFLASHLADIDLMIFNTVINYDSSTELIHQSPVEDLTKLHFTINKAVNLLQVPLAAHKQWEAIADDTPMNEEADSTSTQLTNFISYPKQFKAALKFIGQAEYQWLIAVKHGHNVLEATNMALIYDPQFNLDHILSFCFKNKLIYNNPSFKPR